MENGSSDRQSSGDRDWAFLLLQTKAVQQKAHDEFEKVFFAEHEKLVHHLENKKKEIEICDQQRREQVDNERLLSEKNQELERVLSQKQKAIERLLLAVDEEKRGKLKHWERIIELEKTLDEKKVFELEVISNPMGDDEVRHLKRKIDEVQDKLEERNDRLEYIEQINQVLTVRECSVQEELQKARNKLISLLGESSSVGVIGVKRMGELQTEPFLAAAEMMFSEKVARTRGLEISSKWDNHIRDSNWHPFKVINKNGKDEQILDEDDEKLTELVETYGDEVYKAVTTALKELNEYNSSGRYPVKEIWNFKEERKASLEEAIDFVTTPARKRKVYTRK